MNELYERPAGGILVQNLDATRGSMLLSCIGPHDYYIRGIYAQLVANVGQSMITSLGGCLTVTSYYWPADALVIQKRFHIMGAHSIVGAIAHESPIINLPRDLGTDVCFFIMVAGDPATLNQYDSQWTDSQLVPTEASVLSEQFGWLSEKFDQRLFENDSSYYAKFPDIDRQFCLQLFGPPQILKQNLTELMSKMPYINWIVSDKGEQAFA